jgi:hypothetical protein
MTSYTYIPVGKCRQMKSYLFKVVFAQDKWPDEPDEKSIWRAYVSILPAALPEATPSRRPSRISRTL